MVAGKSPDWLPSGWTMQVKVKNGRKVKLYSNEETGQKLYSKKDVIRYVEEGSGCPGTRQPMSEQNKRHSGNKIMPIVVSTNDPPDWLPHGWIMELKARKGGSRPGSSYKCYIDPATGCKFYSKPGVFQYLKTVGQNNSSVKKKKPDIDCLTGEKSPSKPDVSQNHRTIKDKSCTSERKEIGTEKHSVNNVMVQGVSPDELPPGWIKEIKIRKDTNGTRKDSYFTDPVSGYTFRSKKDVLRYLETGDISSCTTRPKKKKANGLDLKNDENSSPSAVDTKRSRHHTTRRLPFSGKESCHSSISVAPEASSKKRKCNSTSTDAAVASSSTAEILEEKPLVDVNEKCAETKESSDSKPRDSEGIDMEVLGGGSISTPATDILQEQKLPEKTMETHGNKEKTATSKSKKKRELTLPIRSSKRLARLGPDIVGNSGSSERTLRATARNSGEIEADLSTGLAARNSGELEADLSTGLAARNSDEIEADLSTGLAAGNSGEIEADLSNGLTARNSGEIEADLSAGLTARNSGEIEADLSGGLAARNSVGIEADLSGGLAATNSGEIEANLSAGLAARNSGETEANLSASMVPEAAAHRVNQEVEAEQTLVISHHASIDTEALLDKEPSNESEKAEAEQTIEISHHASVVAEALLDKEPSNESEKLFEDQAVLEEQPTEKQVIEPLQSHDPQTFYPFGDSWSDPCLEFAFKTLTGAIPFEDDLAIHSYFQQQLDTSHPQRDGSQVLPEFGLPSFFQNDTSSHFDSPDKNASIPQLPGSSTFLAPGSISLPGCSGTASQQPSLESANMKQR